MICQSHFFRMSVYVNCVIEIIIKQLHDKNNHFLNVLKIVFKNYVFMCQIERRLHVKLHSMQIEWKK